MSNRVLIAIIIPSALALAGVLYVSNHHWLNTGFRTSRLPIGFCRTTYSFFTGVLLFRLYASASRPIVSKGLTHALPWILLAAVTGLLMAAPSDTVQPYFEFITVIFLFPAIIYAALFVQPTGTGARICSFLGAVSYPVYVIHWPLSRLVQGILKSAFHLNVEDYAPWAGFVLLAFLLPFCWFVQKYYDEPVRKKLGAIFKNKSGRRSKT